MQIYSTTLFQVIKKALGKMFLHYRKYDGQFDQLSALLKLSHFVHKKYFVLVRSLNDMHGINREFPLLFAMLSNLQVYEFLSLQIIYVLFHLLVKMFAKCKTQNI